MIELVDAAEFRIGIQGQMRNICERLQVAGAQSS